MQIILYVVIFWGGTAGLCEKLISVLLSVFSLIWVCHFIMDSKPFNLGLMIAWFLLLRAMTVFFMCCQLCWGFFLQQQMNKINKACRLNTAFFFFPHPLLTSVTQIYLPQIWKNTLWVCQILNNNHNLLFDFLEIPLKFGSFCQCHARSSTLKCNL